MPIPEIIHEIDAYLLRLRQARELLASRITNVQAKELPRRKTKAPVRRTDPTPSTRRETAANKSQSNRPVAHLKGEKRFAHPVAQVPGALAPPQAAITEQSTIMQLERAIPQAVAITRLPASRRIGSGRSVRLPSANRAGRTGPEPGKPAIALAGPTNARIVVVSADQLQRERAQAQPVERRPRIAASGLSGKLAFEALFADPTDLSKGSRQ